MGSMESAPRNEVDEPDTEMMRGGQSYSRSRTIKQMGQLTNEFSLAGIDLMDEYLEGLFTYRSDESSLQ